MDPVNTFACPVYTRLVKMTAFISLMNENLVGLYPKK